jgi:hypothetical protein
MAEQNIYQKNGYKNRGHYLNSLADEYAVPVDVVEIIANMLGPTEDFDGLVTMLEDAADSGEY